MMGKCSDCNYCYTNETMDSLYLCVNGKSENFGSFTGLCSEDDCPDCVTEESCEDDYNCF